MSGSIEIIGTESLGVRGMSCMIRTKKRRIVVDPGVALGYRRNGLLPHPLQVAEGVRVRQRLIDALRDATDMVFSHFHGDHIPLKEANPYQLAINQLPDNYRNIRCWSKSFDFLRADMLKRAKDLKALSGANLHVAEEISDGPLSFSKAVPHGGVRGGVRGSVMMTRIDTGENVFVHASDIQLLDRGTIDYIIDWQPDVVFTAGPPLYFDTRDEGWREQVWGNALHLAQNVDTLIIDHHLMRDHQGPSWLESLSEKSGRQVLCAAEFMNRKSLLLEARRTELYETLEVPPNWHETYEAGFKR